MDSADSEPLTGRVEVDGTFFGGPRPGKTGRGTAGKTLVAGAIEITDDRWGRVRLSEIEDASAFSLQAFVKANIASGPTVVTDAWASCPSVLTGYDHEPLKISASG